MRFKLAASVVLMVLVVALDVSAQTPRVVRQSGVVRDEAGQPRAGAATLTFAIYADAEGGAALWTDAQAVTLDADGGYSVVLGAAQPDGLPPELFASGEARWLGVQVQGQADAPRVLLVSVPYALKAADADTVGGKPLSAFVLAGDTTGTGEDGLTYVDTRVLRQALSGTLGPTAGPLPSSFGAPGYIGVFTGTADLGNSIMFQSGTSIGVNTTAPAAAFHTMATAAPGAFFDVYSNALGALPVVYRAARGTPGAPTAVQTDDILGGLAVRGYGATGFSGGQGQVMFRAAEPWTDAAHGTYLQLTTTPLGSASWVERMRITPEGNVGLGTTTPGQKLSVAGTIESTTGGFRFPDGSVQTMAATSDTVNSAFGYFSLRNNTTGLGNSALGSYALQMNTTGSDSTAVGASSLRFNTTGSDNAAVGAYSLTANTTGTGNAAVGASSLTANTTGNGNTAVGASSLEANTTGSYNAAIGTASLSANTTGNYNAAVGFLSLTANTTGVNNAAVGASSLTANTTGVNNAAVGASSLAANTTGFANAAVGESSLAANTTGTRNAAVGYASLAANTTGNFNAAFGRVSLYANTTGSRNIAIGDGAGYQLTTGSNNIAIGNTGIAAEADTIRIGTAGTHTRAFVAGISGVTTGAAGVAVLVDGNGQLGTISSSRRVKDDIADMDAASSALMRLRPVTFHYKSDQNPSGRTLQYGLIAEEVAEVYPGLVARSADGQIETVLYQFLPPMLLNEYQKQQRTIEAQAVELATQTARLDAKANALRAENEALRARVEAGDEQIRTLTDQVAALTRAVAALGDRRQ